MKVKRVLDDLLMNIIKNHPFSLAYRCWYQYIKDNPRYAAMKYYYGYWYRKTKGSKTPTYFIFRFSSPGRGIGSVAVSMCIFYDWAVKNRFIPIIDLESNSVFESGEIGTHNIWEYCFEQAMPIEEVLKQENVYISTIEPHMADQKTCLYINGDKHDAKIHLKTNRAYYAKLNKIASNYLRLNETIRECVDRFVELNFKGSKVLGVALREEFSFYGNVKEDDKDIGFYAKHPWVPGINETIKIITKVFQKWNYNKIFLSTMFEDSIHEFQKEFGDKVIFLERQRMKLDNLNEHVEKIWSNRGDNEFSHNYFLSDKFKKTTEEYIEEIYILTRCQGFMAHPSSIAALCPIIKAGKYEYFYLFEDKHHLEEKLRNK